MTVYVCKICKLEKPYPADFMENYKTQKLCETCRDCRRDKVKKWKLKFKGVPTLGRGWKDTMSGVQSRWKNGEKLKKFKKED